MIELRQSKIVASLGKHLKLSAGDNYIIGKDFIVKIGYGACSYDAFNWMFVWTKKDRKEFYEKKIKFLKYKYTIHALKTLKEFMDEIKQWAIEDNKKELEKELEVLNE